MNARPQIREILIGKKMKRWRLIAQYRFVDPSCPPSRARKNFWRLLGKYPQIAAKLGAFRKSAFTKNGITYPT
jgi:hypothetical protein